MLTTKMDRRTLPRASVLMVEGDSAYWLDSTTDEYKENRNDTIKTESGCW
jgi:hypothetical protein